jgi:hypothetical protein
MHTDAGHRQGFPAASIIESLRRCTGLADAQLCSALAARARSDVPTVILLQAWDAGDIAMPAWVERGCAEWIVELWRSERAACDARELLAIDRKFSRLLRDYSVMELMAVLRITRHSVA